MKIVLLSDIHSNWHYLKQAKIVIEEESAEYIYFLGDAIGYYDEPNKVIEWLRSVNAICIKGNHEHYFLNKLKYDEHLENIYRVAFNKRVITNENKSYIQSWENKIDTVIDNKKILIVHGDEKSSEHHVYNVDDISKDVLKKYDYYIYGHTHIPLIQYSYGCCIINPGSIGQPRDYTTLASYALVDLKKDEVTIKKIQINHDTYLKNLKENHFDTRVIEILKRNMRNESD